MQRTGRHAARESRRWPRIWLTVCAIPAVVVVLAAALSWIWPAIPSLTPVLAVPPALAGVGATSPRRPVTYGAVMMVLAAALIGLGQTLLPAMREAPAPAVISLLAIGFVTIVSGIGASRSAQAHASRQLANVTSVAEVTQRAVLRPLPEQVGPLELSVLYLAAAAGARVGGDLYEVAQTRHGIRIIVGDVRGKGLDAVETAADVLGMFREVAHEVYTLAEIARRLDAGLARRTGLQEEFVTAVLVEIDPDCGEMTIYNCGHPPPILLSAHGAGDGSQVAVPLEVPAPAPPLRLMTMGDWSSAGMTLPFRPHDMLLLYTDGITETRNADGTLYPLAERVARVSWRRRRGRRCLLLERLHDDLLRHAAAPLDDDAAMVLIQAPAAWQGVPVIPLAAG